MTTVKAQRVPLASKQPPPQALMSAPTQDDMTVEDFLTKECEAIIAVSSLISADVMCVLSSSLLLGCAEARRCSD